MKGASAGQPRRALAVGVVASAAKGGGGEVLVVGSSGQTAARVVVELCKSGYKVTAGVDTDLDETKEVVKFARQLEILSATEAANLKLAEFNPLDAASIASVLRRGSRVVLVVGDQAGSRRPDPRLYAAVLDALLECSDRIAQLVVVTPLGGSSTALFGGGGGRGGRGAAAARLSPLEQQVVDSGVSYLLVRAAPSDRVTDRYGEQANVVVAGLGGLPAGLQASRTQVAAVVAQAMALSGGGRGRDAIVEVAASPNAEPADLASQVARALAAGSQDAEAPAAPAGAPAKPAMGGFFTIGGSSSKNKAVTVATVEEEEEEEEAPAPAKPAMGGFFTIGGSSSSKKKAAAVAAVEVEEEAPAPAKRGFSFGGFGAPARKAAPAAVVEDESVEEEAPARPARRGFSFGKPAQRQQAAAAAEDEDEEAEAAAPAKRPGFRFGSSSNSSWRQSSAVAEAAPPPPTAKVVRGRAPVAAPAPPQQQQRSQPPAAEGKKKAAGGMFSFLGISQDTAFVDDL